jgi:hypothetical protein
MYSEVAMVEDVAPSGIAPSGAIPEDMKPVKLKGIVAYFKGGPIDKTCAEVEKKLKMFPVRLDETHVAWYAKSNKKVIVTSKLGKTTANMFRFERVMENKKAPVNNLRINTL